MTENKRFTYENHKVKDNLTGEFHSSNRVSVNVLNSLNDENEQLKQKNKELEEELEQIIDTISKDYEKSHGMDIRNAEWFTAW